MKEAMENGGASSKLVFHTRYGNPIKASNMMEQYKKVTDRLKLDICFHDLRHTSATMVLEAGITPNVVQERLGHSDIKVTLGIYGHVTKKLQDQPVQLLDSLISGYQNAEAL